MKTFAALSLALLLNSSAQAQPATPKLISPVFPVWRQSQEPVEFDVEGPAGQNPALSVGDQPIVLEEFAPGKFQAKINGAGDDLSVVLNGQKLGVLHTLSGPRQIVEVVNDRAIFRNGPDSAFDRYTPVAAGVRFEVVGRQGAWLHVACPDAFINEKDTKALAPGSSLRPSAVEAVHFRETADGAAEVRVRLFAPCAWQILEDPEAGRLCVDFPGAPMKMFEMAFAQDAQRIPSARLLARPDGTRLDLLVNEGLWGYQTRWEKDELVLSLAAPIRANRRPFDGIRITLDAGHGGTDSGAPGPNGGHEKDYNLAVTQALQKELEEAGAVVSMTRSGDRELTPDGSSADQELSARVQFAEKSQAQLFVSIHHNASADEVAGKVAHGCHIYYYQPHSRAMAQAIAKPLADSMGEPSYMHVWRSFHLTRQTGMPAILVECNFVSNPRVEKEILMQPEYARKAARGIRQGLENYLLSSSTKK